MNEQQAAMFYNLYGFWPVGFGPDSKPAWVPTFESGTVTDGVQNWSINCDYLATAETADEVMRRFGGDAVKSVKYQGGFGMFASSAKERWVVWRDGTAVNAGILAAQFRRSNERYFPHVAENACWNLIAMARQSGQKLPKE